MSKEFNQKVRKQFDCLTMFAGITCGNNRLTRTLEKKKFHTIPVITEVFFSLTGQKKLQSAAKYTVIYIYFLYLDRLLCYYKNVLETKMITPSIHTLLHLWAVSPLLYH